MAVPTRITDFSATAASNSPTGSESVGTSLDDYLRGYQAVVRGDLAHKGSDIASATTTDLGAVLGLMHDITGTTTITGFGTVAAGVWKIVKFEGALTLTHNATSLILPGAANITTAAGDIGIFISEGSGNWRCVTYFKAGALYVTTSSTDTLTNKTLTAPTLSGALAGDAIAAQAEMETGTATDSIVSPGRQHFHQSSVKKWANFEPDAGPQIFEDYGFSSIVRDGAGEFTLNFDGNMATSTYAAVIGNANVSGVGNILVATTVRAVGSLTISNTGASFVTLADVTGEVSIAIMGDL